VSVDLETLEAQMLSLDLADRSHLLERLVASLDADREVQDAWAAEAERRAVESDLGKVRPIPGLEVLTELRAQFQ
jgi:Putative addiction module component